MEWLGTEAQCISEWIEAILWAATWVAILGFRDEAGRPLWMSGGPSGRMQR